MSDEALLQYFYHSARVSQPPIFLTVQFSSVAATMSQLSLDTMTPVTLQDCCQLSQWCEDPSRWTLHRYVLSWHICQHTTHLSTHCMVHTCQHNAHLSTHCICQHTIPLYTLHTCHNTTQLSTHNTLTYEMTQ